MPLPHATTLGIRYAEADFSHPRHEKPAATGMLHGGLSDSDQPAMNSV
jgi:hypothetical protein